METRIYPMNFGVKEIALSLQQAIVGYGFRPTEEELINYLKSEVPGWRESFCIIPTLENIYAINPSDLPAKFNAESIIPSNDQEWWFICPQTQTQNQRISRKTPCGSWKITGNPKNIEAENEDKKIGSKKRLVFPDGGPTRWVIHEYHLLDNDLNRNYVLCHLMRRRDEKADNSTIESELEAIRMANLESYLHQSDEDGSFSEDLVRARMNSLIENFESPSAMEITVDGDLTDEYIRFLSETSEEDEDVGYMLNGDPIDDDFFHGDQIQTQYDQIPNLHNECPVLMENRRTQRIDSLHGVVPLEEKKGIVENKFNGSLVAPKKPMATPVCSASVNYSGKDEALRFDKVKHETAAKSIKPECIFLDEAAARTKNGQMSIMENRQMRTIGSLHGVAPLEQKKGVIQSKFNSSHVSTAKPMELPRKPQTPKKPESSRIYTNEELRLEKVKKQEFALRNVKTECVSLDVSAPTAKVLKYQEHYSVSNSPRKTNGREIENARKKANSVTALTRPTTKSTKSSTNPSLPNLVNVLVGIFLLLTLTRQVLDI